MKKNKLSFIFALIANLFCLPLGFFTFLVGGLFSALITGLGGDGEGLGVLILQILGVVCFLGAILGIIGAIIILKKVKTGTILLIVSSVMTTSLLITVFINLVSATEISILKIILNLVLIALVVLALVFAFLSIKDENKEKQVKNIQNLPSESNEIEKL